MATAQNKARTLSTRLARILHGFLAGSADQVQTAKQLRALASWIDRGAEGPKKGKKADAEQVVALYEYWVQATHRDLKRTKLTPGRKAKLEARLKEGYSVSDIKAAIDAVAQSLFHQGENERQHRYDDLTLICRSGDQVEKYRELLPKSVQSNEPEQDEIAELAEEASEALKRGEMNVYHAANKRLFELRSR